MVFGQLVQKLEQISPNTSTLQDDENEWSQCCIWTAGSIVRTLPDFTKLVSAGQGQICYLEALRRGGGGGPIVKSFGTTVPCL